MSRHFQILSSSVGIERHGHYQDEEVYAAARRAGRQLFQMVREARAGTKLAECKRKRVIRFELRETTRGSKNKVYCYKMKCTKKKEPAVFEKNGVKIESEYEYHLTSLGAHKGERPLHYGGQEQEDFEDQQE